jgi:hypothetical protein
MARIPFTASFLCLLSVVVEPQTAPTTVRSSASDIDIRIDTVSHTAKNEDAGAWQGKDIAVIVSAFVGLMGVIVAVIVTKRNTTKEHWLKANQAEAEYLQRKLDEFYGPFMLMSQANHLLAQDLRDRQPAPKLYRLLDKLFDENWQSNLSEGDKTLVDEICNTGKRLNRFIATHSGIVDVAIMPYLSRAMAHFRILYLAHQKKLGTSSKPFLRYVYPEVLDAVVKEELKRLQDRLQLLRQDPTTNHGELPALDALNLLKKYPLPPWPDPNPRAQVVDNILVPALEGQSMMSTSTTARESK